ncbi:MAG: Serine/threonine-protein kinase PknD [Chroococcopsis gigantea SAG 12.99]|jgi:serine/threonine protein kinase|nr:protein kinase [Chlorogloea purpurea SAG 13.99]MDV3001061.1 Serine/threonine-protein kinase PknD [Chroococcopsis gigantea SAG 12.99]
MSILCTVCLTDNPNTESYCIACGSSLLLNQQTGEAEATLSNYHLPVNTVLNNGKQQYAIDKLLGQGGFGITYKGSIPSQSRQIAIKELWPDNASRQGKKVLWSPNITPASKQEQINKFKDEARNQEQCTHPNIAEVYDYFEENNTVYIVMEFIKGDSLHKILRGSGKLSEERAKRVFIQIAEALKNIHARNFLHRDIKPDNIIITPGEKAILIDFGATREFMAGLTQDMSRILTPGYAPLEQYNQRSRRVPATDIYALCASMYEALTGQLPLQSTERVAQTAAQNPDPLVPPRKLRADLSPLMEKVLLTGMNINANDRFQTADDFIQALNGNFVSPQHQKAMGLVRQGGLQESLTVYDRCIVNDSTNSNLYVERALVQLHLNDYGAEETIQKAIKIDPNNYRAYCVLGVFYLQVSKIPEALIQFNKAYQGLQSNPFVVINLAFCLRYYQEWNKINELSDRALNTDKTNPFYLALKTIAAYFTQDWKTAIAKANPVIFQAKQKPTKNNLYIGEIVFPYLIFSLDKYGSKDLERRVDEFIRQFPDRPLSWGIKGYYLAKKGSWQQAIINFEQACKLPKAPDWVYINYGLAKERLNDFQGAINIYKNYLNTFGKNYFVNFRLGTLMAQAGEWEKAKLYLETAISIENKLAPAEAYHNLAWVLLQIRRSDGEIIHPHEVIDNYRAAIALYRKQNNLKYVQAIQKQFQSVGIPI